uniref:Chromo domain-containing protein n=1 Tax=Anisakis simplex TaxID=6269 RepID=A0A0M3JEC9_ANISI
LYKVRWLGFDEADDTWEPYENLAEDCDRLIETFYLNSEGEEGNLNENQIDDEFAEELIEGGGSHEELGEGFMDSLIQSEVDGTIVVARGQLQQEDGISYEEDGTSEKIVSEESAKLEEFKEGPMEDDVSELQQQLNGLND